MRMREQGRVAGWIGVLLVVVLLASSWGCASTGTKGAGETVKKTAVGAVIGAGIGALLGGADGAVSGAIAGGALGYVSAQAYGYADEEIGGAEAMEAEFAAQQDVLRALTPVVQERFGPRPTFRVKVQRDYEYAYRRLWDIGRQAPVAAVERALTEAGFLNTLPMPKDDRRVYGREDHLFYQKGDPLPQDIDLLVLVNIVPGDETERRHFFRTLGEKQILESYTVMAVYDARTGKEVGRGGSAKAWEIYNSRADFFGQSRTRRRNRGFLSLEFGAMKAVEDFLRNGVL